MAFTEKTEFNLNIRNDGQMEVQKKRIILEDGAFLVEKNFRLVLEPGDDITNQPKKIRDIAAIVWTPQVIADYRAAKNANLT